MRNERGRNLAVTILGYDLDGNVTSRVIKDAGNTTVFSRTHDYDELGRLLRDIGAGGETTTFAYDKTDLLKTGTTRAAMSTPMPMMRCRA